MQAHVVQDPTVVRRVFPTWWISLPVTFADTFLAEEDYWHAWEAHRSVSLSSFVVSEDGEPVTAERIEPELQLPDGQPVDGTPPGVRGRAVVVDTIPPAIASRCVTGILAADGRVLLVTITSDDLEWATRTWRSIRYRLGDPSETSPALERES